MPETVVHENDTAVEIHNLQIIWLKNNAKNSKIPGDAVTSELSIKPVSYTHLTLPTKRIV